MPVRLTCTECKATLKVRDDLAGKKVKCPRCAHVLIVPTPSEEDIPTINPIAEDPAPVSRKSRPSRDEEDEDEDRDQEEEEKDARPSKRSSGIRKTRDDDRPSKRGSGIRKDRDREEEDEDDRPRKRSSAIRKDRDREEEEEEEDRNRKRSAIRKGRDRDRDSEDEEEEEDRDRDERKGRKSKYKPCPQCGARGAQKVLWTAWGSFYGPAMFTHVKCPQCSYCYNGKTGRSNLIPAIIFFCVPLFGILAIIGALIGVLYWRGYL